MNEQNPINMLVTFISVVSLFFLTLISCNTSNSPINRINSKLPLSNTDSLIQIIPGDSSITLMMVRKESISLGLPPLDKGKKGFQLRIWEEYAKNTGIVILFDYSNKSWSAKGYYYNAYSTDGSWFWIH